MKKWSKSILLFSFVLVTACVTINVYFPAAEVESAAEKIVKDVLNEEPVNPEDDDQTILIREPGVRYWAQQLNPLNWVISSAQAQADITLSSPAINELTA